MSFRDRWNSPINKAAIKAILPALFTSGIINGGLAYLGGNPSFASFGIIALLAWGAGTFMALQADANSTIVKRGRE